MKFLVDVCAGHFLAEILKVHEKDLAQKAIIIQKGSKIRISYR